MGYRVGVHMATPLQIRNSTAEFLISQLANEEDEIF